MANQLADSLRRLRMENAAMTKTIQEQERTILQLRSSLSEVSALNAHLRKLKVKEARHGG